MKRYPVEPLHARMAADGVTISELARRLSYSRQTIQRWRHVGIPEDRVDGVAVALGYLPHEIWPDWLEDHIERERERLRALERERRRRYRANSATYYASQLASARRYKDENRAYVRAHYRRFYAENRERLLAARRERRSQAS